MVLVRILNSEAQNESLAFRQPLLQAILLFFFLYVILFIWTNLNVVTTLNIVHYICIVMYQILASWWNRKMPRRVAVTHADLEPSRGSADLASKTGALLIVLTILCGLFSFILCLIAEATHSQMISQSESNDKGGRQIYECVYSGNGKVPLLSAAIAFLILAIAMVVEHTYMLIAVSKLPSPSVASWQPDFGLDKSLTWQAGFFFVTTWICFAVAEILLLVGLSVESGHLRNWYKPRPSCLIIRDGLFCAAGVFSLATVFLAACLYLTALRAQKILQQQENLRRQILETSVLYASPPRSPPPHFMTTVEREDPIIRGDTKIGIHNLSLPHFSARM